MPFKTLRYALISYREKHLVPRYAYNARSRSEGLLRRKMIDYFCDVMPRTEEEFYDSVDPWLLHATSSQQLNSELPRLMKFIRDLIASLENQRTRTGATQRGAQLY